MVEKFNAFFIADENDTENMVIGEAFEIHSRNPNTEFGEDIRNSLTASHKAISPKWFYDAEGSRLFQEVMAAEEYYLTDCEYEIFDTQKAKILDVIPSSFDLVELGAGDGLKTKILLRYLLSKKVDFNYLPVDISLDILNVLTDSLEEEMPDLSVMPWHDDYFGALQKISTYTERPKVVIFLGGNIGNFSVAEAEAFLQKLRSSLNKGDLLLSGFDLVKDPKVLLAAYDDSAGAFSRFCYNTLQRINNELGGNFDLTKFAYHINYPPQTNAMNMNLVSKVAQKVWIEDLQLEVAFEPWEGIRTMFSQKFSLKEISEIAENAGFKVNKHFFDRRKYFTDSLWEAI